MIRRIGVPIRFVSIRRGGPHAPRDPSFCTTPPEQLSTRSGSELHEVHKNRPLPFSQADDPSEARSKMDSISLN